MHYELEVLDDLVSDTLHPDKILRIKPYDQQVLEWIELVEHEKERNLRIIRKSMSTVVPENSKIEFNKQNQSVIIRLLDDLNAFLQQKDFLQNSQNGEKGNIESLYKTVLLALEEILFYLKDNFPHYFDNDIKIPDAHKRKVSTEMGTELKMLRKILQQKNIDVIFENLICEPFENFILSEKSFSYRETAYLQELQTSLIELLKLKQADTVDLIFEKLFYLNFNSVRFYNYCILQLKDEASKQKSVPDIMEYYSLQIKIINQRIVKSDCIYLPHLNSIHELLVSWISEDLHFLNTKHKLKLVLPAANEVSKQKAKKVHANVTVSDLALGARLLLDDVIINANYSELMDMVATNFRTNRRESLSKNNTYNEGFNFSVVTKEKMKRLLLKLSRKVNEF